MCDACNEPCFIYNNATVDKNVLLHHAFLNVLVAKGRKKLYFEYRDFNYIETIDIVIFIKECRIYC